MILAIAHVQTSLAYDTDGRRTPDRDDWTHEDLGWLSMDEAELPGFMKSRYPKAIDWRVEWRAEANA